MPDFAPNGLLPPGIHQANWREVARRFSWSATRLRLLDGLRLALNDLSAAGCRKGYLDGSFVTKVDEPGDFDLCWDTYGVDVSLLHPVLRDTRPPRIAQRIRYRGDILPNVIERSVGKPFIDFFQSDKLSGKPKGIVSIALPLTADL